MAVNEFAEIAPWRRLRQWPGRLLDFASIAGLLVLGALILVASTGGAAKISTHRIPLFLLVFAAIAALIPRRAYPLISWTAIVGAALVEALIGSTGVLHPLVLVAVYIVASRMDWRLSLALTGVAFLLFFLPPVFHHKPPTFGVLLADCIALGTAYVVGLYASTRAAYVKALGERAREQQKEHELMTQNAVASERVRIARELHDIVSHNLSLMIVQSEALRAQIAGDSPAAATATTIAGAGRRAMDDMRRMLGVLRLGAGDEPEHAPQPGIADIPSLVDDVRKAGLEVGLSVDSGLDDVSPAASLTVYRIVQEALTNVLRHAQASRCDVSVHRSGDALEIAVNDDGKGDSHKPSPGHGLVGMRERVAAFGGKLVAESAAAGGFTVRATLPLRSVE